ncbi:hypothetical protein FACS1894127_7850 [Clostridia bacterium]|nr:hypothetical protein FACS1894127_7850 [Clostridia bacterium]
MDDANGNCTSKTVTVTVDGVTKTYTDNYVYCTDCIVGITNQLDVRG